MPGNQLSKSPCANLPTASLREKSNSKLETAIRGEHDAGATLKRVNQCLAAFFDPNLDDPHTQAGVREEFVRALAGKPQWAIERAFDQWMATRHRRPSPGEINTTVAHILEPLRRELDTRRRNADREKAERERAQADRPSPEEAASILEAYGFTPKRFEMVRNNRMAGVETLREDDRPRHWSEGADPDRPEMQALKAARESNKDVQAALATQQRNSGGGDERTA